MGAETHTVNYRPRDGQKISNLTMNSGGEEDGMLQNRKALGRKLQQCEANLPSISGTLVTLESPERFTWFVS